MIHPSELDSIKQVLIDARIKHGLSTINENDYDLQCLVRYVHNIGFNEGYKSGNKLKPLTET